MKSDRDAKASAASGNRKYRMTSYVLRVGVVHVFGSTRHRRTRHHSISWNFFR